MATVRIPLISIKYPNLFAVVDESDVELVSQFRWNPLFTNGRIPYAIGYGQNGKRIYMHRLITSASKGLVVDHINHNTLDNRRGNLRVCSNAENCRNKIRTPGKSGSVGIRQITNSERWEAKITWDGIVYVLGRYDSPEEASLARQEAETSLAEGRLSAIEGSYPVGVSGHRGVGWEKRSGKWRVQTLENGVYHWGGRFATIEEAVSAYSKLRDELS